MKNLDFVAYQNKKFHIKDTKNPNNITQMIKVIILISVNNFLTSDDTFLVYGLFCSTCKLKLCIIINTRYIVFLNKI